MAKFNFFNMLFVVVCSVLMAVVSCMKLDPETINTFDPNQAVGVKYLEKPESDTLVMYTFKDPRERFVEVGVEYSFIPVEIYSKKGEVEGQRISYVVPVGHVGIEAQYFHYEDTKFSTTYGNETALENTSSTSGSWEILVISKEQGFKASNGSNQSFTHSTTTGAAKVTYTKADEGDLKGYVVEFAAPSWTLSEETLENVNVSGVYYEGKTWDAEKYESVIPATFEIAEAYRMTGEEWQKTIEVSNLAFFLKHVIDTRLENLRYTGEFNTVGANLKTKVQRVEGELNTYDNNEIVNTDKFSLNMNLFYTLSQPEDIWVSSEEALRDETFTYTAGNISENVKTSGVFSGKEMYGMDAIVLADRSVDAGFGWASWAWGSTILPYAQIKERNVISVKSVRNDAACTNSVLCYTVTVTSKVKVSFAGVDRADEEYVVSVSYNRYYNLPDDITYEFKQIDFVLKLQNETASKISAKEEYNLVRKVVKNRGELVSSSEVTYPLGMYALICGGDTVKVEAPFKPTVSGIEDHQNTGDVKVADEFGFAARWIKDSQTIRIKGGNVIDYEWYYEVQTRDKSDIYDYAEVKGASADAFSFTEPVLVDSARTEKSLVKVYRIDVSFLPTITSTTKATKAGDTNVNDLNVTVPIYQMVVEGDKYIEGADEVEWYVETDGTSITVGGRLYENYTLSGRIYADGKSQTLTPKLTGKDGDDVIVDSADNFEQEGNGHNGTGNGTYTNYASRANEKYAYTFDYNAPTSVTINLNGKSGKGASKTFEPTFKIDDVNLVHGSSYISGTYTVYPKTSNVKGVYSIEDKSVELTADATRNFKVAIPQDEFVSDRIVKTVTKNGNTISWKVQLYETWSLSGEMLKDEKSGTVTPSLNGSDGGEIVVSNINFTTSGNGATMTGEGTYTDTASNGTDSFSNSYSYNAPASITVQLNGTYGTKNETISTSWKLVENGQKIGNASTSNGYYVYPYTNEVKGTYTVENQSINLTAKATKTLKVEIPDTFVSDRIEKTVTKSGNSIVWNVKLYETWSKTGEKLKDEKSGTITPSLTGSNGGEIVVSNSNFATSGNGVTTTGEGTYTDTASNGTDSFSNSYSYNAPASISVKLNGTNGTKTETISTSWNLVENGQKIGNATVNGYYSYPYTNEVKGTYTVENQSIELTATATKTLKVVRNVPDIIPGKIIGGGMSCVPGHAVGSEFADGKGKQSACSCLTIITEDGGRPVVFGYADQAPIVPTTDQILAAPFTAGSYPANYNSGVFMGGKWVPAYAADYGAGSICYSIPTYANIRDIPGSSLAQWGWRGGNYSCMMSAYNVTVDSEGIMTVRYNGQIVLELK